MSDNRFSLDDDEMSAASSENHNPGHGGGFGPPNGGNAGGGDDDYSSEERFRNDEARLLDFLQYPREKRKLTDFMEETFKAYEKEAVERTINRVIHEHESESQGATPYYQPGHIGPLMYQYLNMIGVEAAFVSGLQHTKASMTKTVQQRVDEINTLLRGVGGFNRQLKASFSRSAVVYLEQEDPYEQHREFITFTVNLGDFELRHPLNTEAENKAMPDGRTLRRFVWDEAVNTLCEIVSNTGMKPKYVKNDKNTGRITMRQSLLSSNDREPDEFFKFDLRYMNEEMRQEMANEYVETIDNYDAEIAKQKASRDAWWNFNSDKKMKFQELMDKAKKDKEFYIATNPDPREMDNGLIFSISVNTLKDYSITKDRIQFIMTRYILALSNVAYDKSSDQQVNTVYQSKQAKARDFQSLQEEIKANSSDKKGAA